VLVAGVTPPDVDHGMTEEVLWSLEDLNGWMRF
jgi:hypothetical protein